MEEVGAYLKHNVFLDGAGKGEKGKAVKIVYNAGKEEEEEEEGRRKRKTAPIISPVLNPHYACSGCGFPFVYVCGALRRFQQACTKQEYTFNPTPPKKFIAR